MHKRALRSPFPGPLVVLCSQMPPSSRGNATMDHGCGPPESLGPRSGRWCGWPNARWSRGRPPDQSSRRAPRRQGLATTRVSRRPGNRNGPLLADRQQTVRIADGDRIVAIRLVRSGDGGGECDRPKRVRRRRACRRLQGPCSHVRDQPIAYAESERRLSRRGGTSSRLIPGTGTSPTDSSAGRAVGTDGGRQRRVGTMARSSVARHGGGRRLLLGDASL